MMFPLLAIVFLAEAIAVVNGKPITREELEKGLKDDARQTYHEALSDLRDYEHAAVRDYLGRQAVEREAREHNLPADSVYARVMSENFDAFDPNLRNHIQQQRERVFATERSALEELIGRSLFQAAALARGMTPEELTRRLASQVAPVAKTDLDFIKAYEDSKQEIRATVPPGESRLETAIHNARIEQLRLAVIDSARARTKIASRLEPPRIAVSTAGAPRIGPATAPVRVVVFTDFECPYCWEAEQMLSRIQKQYGDRVALYYLNYPLPAHPNAMPAARAAVCAAEQGRYAAYHDLVFTHQADLAHADYAAWAEAAGLNRAAFEKCRSSEMPQRRVEQDIREGIAAGVAGTPTFLVNGRLVNTSESLPAIIAEEVAASR